MRDASWWAASPYDYAMKLRTSRRHQSAECVCSFCKKTRSQVAKVIAGPEVFICDECIRAANRILEDEGIPT